MSQATRVHPEFSHFLFFRAVFLKAQQHKCIISPVFATDYQCKFGLLTFSLWAFRFLSLKWLDLFPESNMPSLSHHAAWLCFVTAIQSSENCHSLYQLWVRILFWSKTWQNKILSCQQIILQDFKTLSFHIHSQSQANFA